MKRTNASNWVDRGEPPEPTLARVLSSYLHLDLATAATQLEEYARIVRGMAEADATEVHIASYLRTLEEQRGIASRQAGHRRAVAIALWHITKAGEVRDRAQRLLGDATSRSTDPRPPLSTWLAERLLRNEKTDPED